MSNGTPRVTQNAYAKINLCLEIIGKRADNYHDITSVMQMVDLYDTLDFDEADGLTVECDDPALAWDYDYLREQIEGLATERRYNLQESLAHALYDRFAGMRGVSALRVITAKPDVYPEARAVGVELASFSGPAPQP